MDKPIIIIPLFDIPENKELINAWTSDIAKEKGLYMYGAIWDIVAFECDHRRSSQPGLFTFEIKFREFAQKQSSTATYEEVRFSKETPEFKTPSTVSKQVLEYASTLELAIVNFLNQTNLTVDDIELKTRQMFGPFEGWELPNFRLETLITVKKGRFK